METQYQPVSNKPRKIKYSEVLLCKDLHKSPCSLWQYGAYIKRKYHQGATVTYNQMFPSKEIAEKFIKLGHVKNHNMKGHESHCFDHPY